VCVCVCVCVAHKSEKRAIDIRYVIMKG
jgi:hypothetical protein